MTNRALTIVTVNSADLGGGAERVGRELHTAYGMAGADAWLAVGRKRGTDAHTVEIPNAASRSPWARRVIAAADALPQRGAGFRAARLLRERVAEPARWAAQRRGEEDCDFPGTRHLLGLSDRRPDVLHLHNLHGGYFDLRELPRLTQQVPTIVTLHDAWLLSGHCAHSFDCGRWESGCGNCPALWIYPAIPRDATAFNWNRKRGIFSASALHVAVPCQWLADRVRRSMLMPAVRSLRVIPYGIDLDIFRPASKAAIRRELGLDPQRPVMVVFANALRANTWKDSDTFRAALQRLGAQAAAAQWIALGESGPDEIVGDAVLRRVGSDPDDRRFARWLQAATAYVHPARADTSPLVVLESLACGTPVIALGVGGIPEQIESSAALTGAIGVPPDRATGAVVPPGDAAALATAINAVVALDPIAYEVLSANAARSARERFDSRRHAGDYLQWMRELAGVSSGAAGFSGGPAT